MWTFAQFDGVSYILGTLTVLLLLLVVASASVIIYAQTTSRKTAVPSAGVAQTQLTPNTSPQATNLGGLKPTYNRGTAKQRRSLPWWLLPIAGILALVLLLCGGTTFIAHSMHLWPSISATSPVVNNQASKAFVLTCSDGTEFLALETLPQSPNFIEQSASSCADVNTDTTLLPSNVYNYMVIQRTLGDLPKGVGTKPNKDTLLNSAEWGNNLNIFAYTNLTSPALVDKSDLANTPTFVIKVPKSQGFTTAVTGIIDYALVVSGDTTHVYWKTTSDIALPVRR